ncbi:hypothetical protein [Streptomyces pinistramenti]|uniref:hypothetical protein n=1 Tax=Streptomyces pinistramenti TaxID=2884812 RepID=UPI001D083EFA|nr:hypothetical protein [Streptomyces pinistramenti]MCB5909827.1 hypothetical protein [Streptomyces pinistramenti]
MTAPPRVYVYDRTAAHHSRRLLDQRLLGCRNTAERYGWEVVGVWMDLDLDAMTELPSERPKFMRLVQQMNADGHVLGRPVMCLVHNWDRLTTDNSIRPAFQRHVLGAGGHTATTFDESDARARDAFVGRHRA